MPCVNNPELADMLQLEGTLEMNQQHTYFEKRRNQTLERVSGSLKLYVHLVEEWDSDSVVLIPGPMFLPLYHIVVRGFHSVAHTRAFQLVLLKMLLTKGVHFMCYEGCFSVSNNHDTLHS